MNNMIDLEMAKQRFQDFRQEAIDESLIHAAQKERSRGKATRQFSRALQAVLVLLGL